jgi:hypothetical protein
MHNFATSTGRVFESTYQAFAVDQRLPETRLAHDHPFWTLWRDHCSSFLSKDADDLIDALVAIKLQLPNWDDGLTPTAINKHRQTMRDVLSMNPPDVILLKGITDYGYHVRSKPTMKYICINKEYVDLWLDAKGDLEYLALTALLRACVDHEIGHWIQSLLVSSQLLLSLASLIFCKAIW